MSRASVWNSSTQGNVLDYNPVTHMYLIDFDSGGVFWVKETEIVNMWNTDDE